MMFPLLPNRIPWLAIAATFATASSAIAEVVTLLQSDATGTNSFISAGNWSNAIAPIAGNDYSVTGIEDPAETFNLRAPTNATFAGDSLTINDHAVLAWAPSANTGTLTVANLILNGGSVANFRTGGTLTLAGNLNVTATSSLRLGSGANTSTRNITLNSTVTGDSPLVMLAQNNSASTLTVNGDNSSFSAGFKLDGSAAENVSSTLVVGHANALGTGTVTVDQGILDLNGFSVTTGGLAGANESGAVVRNNGGTAATLTVESAADTSFAGLIQNGSGNLSLTKSGPATLTLTGSHTYSGDTVVSSGTLDLGSTGSIANSASLAIAAAAGVDAAAQSRFALAASQPVTFGIDPSGTGTSGTLHAQELDITNAVVAIDLAAPLDDSAYVLATYTRLTGTAFATPPAIPSGYELQYAYQGNKIALVQTGEGTPYETWSGNQPFDGDANGDGVSNGLAFLLGTTNPQENARALLPAGTHDNGVLTLTFSYRNAASRGNADLALEHSADLGFADAWVAVPVPDANGGPVQCVTFTVTPGDPLHTVTATIAASEATAGKLFARLTAVEN